MKMLSIKTLKAMFFTIRCQKYDTNHFSNSGLVVDDEAKNLYVLKTCNLIEDKTYSNSFREFNIIFIHQFFNVKIFNYTKNHKFSSSFN